MVLDQDQDESAFRRESQLEILQEPFADLGLKGGVRDLLTKEA